MAAEAKVEQKAEIVKEETRDKQTQANDLIQTCLKSRFKSGFDAQLYDYLSSIIMEGTQVGDITNKDQLTESILNSLVTKIDDYDKCVEEAEALFEDLVKAGLFKLLKSPEQLKRDALMPGALVMVCYWEDEQWYDCDLTKYDKFQDIYSVTFRSYGNSEDLEFTWIKPLYFQAEKTMLDKPVKLRDMYDTQETQEIDSAIYNIIFREGQYQEKEFKEEEVLSKKQKKEWRKEQERKKYLKQFDPEVYYESLRKQKPNPEWLDGGPSGVMDVIIKDYTLYTLDNKKVLLEEVELRLLAGQRYGLIGKNGSGKTTLLRRISRYDIEEFPRRLRVYHCEQEIKGDDMTVLEYVLQADIVRRYLLDREKALFRRQEDGDDITKALDVLYEQFEDFEVRTAQARAEQILKGLHFHEEMMHWATSRLSGGWRMRVALASALFVNPEILLLDEPTNHLDFPSVLWLENYINDYDGTIIIVSHDRDFLDHTVNNIIHLAYGTLTYYRGDYRTFVKTKLQNETTQAKAYKAQQKKIKDMQRFIDQNRANAKKGALVQSRIKEMQKMKRVIKPIDEKQLVFRFPECQAVEGPIITAQDLVFGYASDRLLVKKIDVQVDCSTRVGIIGANGAGKSTLLALLLEQLHPLHGTVVLDRGVKIAVFTQHHIDQLDLRQTPIEFLLTRFEDDLAKVEKKVQEVRKRLAGFGIRGDLVEQRMLYLSGGQKSRVALTAMMWRRPAFIVMDEPTNHLDSETIDALVMAIQGFQGGVLVVSHDQYFLQAIANDFWLLNEGSITKFKDLTKARDFACKL